MELIKKFRKNTQQLSDLIDSFSDDQFAMKPSEDEWSAAEILEHLYRSEFGIPKLFNGESNPSDRDADAYVQKMENALLNYSKKTQAPEFIQPKNSNSDKADLLAKFSTNREKIVRAYLQNSPNEICLLYPHPFYGSLTRLEWLNFCILHAQRHIHQLKGIQKILK